MSDGTIDIVKLFNQAWVELYCPPVRLILEEEKKRPDTEARFTALNGTVHLKPDIVPRGCDPDEYLVWYFRHELAHVHHCPYDIKTAYSLEKAAYGMARDWSIAYLATHIFSDVQIDLNYLPRRFRELPYFARVIGDRSKSLAEQIMQEIYLCVHRAYKPRNQDIADSAKEILAVSLLDRTWHTKVKMIAHVLSRLRDRNPKIVSQKTIARYIASNPLHVREDFQHSSLEMFTETYGSISDEPAAKEFFKQWIEPRLSREETERIKEMVKDKLKTGKAATKERKGRGPGISKEMLEPEELGPQQKEITGRAPGNMLGQEPRLPTSLSQPYGKLKPDLLDETLWKRYWYKSRAERTIIQFLAESRSRRPVWAVMQYPDEWYIEDEIEALDVETSLDEGPLIPEVTTLKWVEEPTPHGQTMVSGFVPSAITILDASRSMSNARDEAAIAAFIAFLSARRAGGQTATTTFSTRFVSADWNSPEEMKELTLSMAFGEFTIFPAYEVLRLVQDNPGPCFVVIITDGGWQNIDEAVPFLEKIADSGHKIVIFLLKGGEYADRIEYMKRTPDLR
ncbi:MAG: hypothetical protein NWE76_03980, partial [Candidatus Bathyarchaeota archaeon]|nr:hypothetical protein [Candidatus Bathyarchaeota archaeon]